MYRDILLQSIRFIFLVVLQVFVLNQMFQYNLLHPFVYPLFILLLPVNTSFFLVLILSFVIGYTVDLLQLTSGIQAAATVFMGFLRIFFLQATLSKENSMVFNLCYYLTFCTSLGIVFFRGAYL